MDARSLWPVPLPWSARCFSSDCVPDTTPLRSHGLGTSICEGSSHVRFKSWFSRCIPLAFLRKMALVVICSRCLPHAAKWPEAYQSVLPKSVRFLLFSEKAIDRRGNTLFTTSNVARNEELPCINLEHLFEVRLPPLHVTYFWSCIATARRTHVQHLSKISQGGWKTSRNNNIFTIYCISPQIRRGLILSNTNVSKLLQSLLGVDGRKVARKVTKQPSRERLYKCWRTTPHGDSSEDRS